MFGHKSQALLGPDASRYGFAIVFQCIMGGNEPMLRWVESVMQNVQGLGEPYSGPQI